MPFIVSRPQPNGRLFAVVDGDGDVQFGASRERATRLTEAKADALAADLARYSTDDFQVEGAKDAPSPNPGRST